MSAISARDHLVLTCSVQDEPGMPLGWTARILILRTPDGSSHVYWLLWDYFVAHWPRSDAWQACVARALGLFWDFCQARIPTLDVSHPIHWRNRELLRSFGAALVNGTIRNLDDPLELYWSRLPLDIAKRLVYSIEQFAEWCAREAEEPNQFRDGAKRSKTVADVMLEAVISVKRQGFSLLGFLETKTDRGPSLVPFPKLGRPGSTSNTAPLSFPPYAIEDVLWTGFRRTGRGGDSWDDYNLAAMMIFLLGGYAGAREHEPHHLWVGDVTEHPIHRGRALVSLYHPEQGLAYVDDLNGRKMRTTRAQKLSQEYGLPSRNYGISSYRVGWKHSKVSSSDNYAELYWTDPTAGVLFLILYRAYLLRRMAVMQRRRALGYGDHPFLFVSEREARNVADGAKYIGAPATIQSYEQALRTAVDRCGLPYGKLYGTTSQGPRHLFAYTMRILGATQIMLQEGLRHRSPLSGDRYGLPGPSDVNRFLVEAEARGRTALPTEVKLERSLEWINEHHPEYGRGIV